MSTAESFWLSILANGLTTTIYIALALAVLGGFWILDRRHLLAFFRLSSGERRLTVLTSRLEITQGSVQASEPLVPGYIGPAIVRMEYLGAEAIAQLFWPVLIPHMPTRWRQWVLERTPRVSGVNVTIDTCPLDRDLLPHGTVVLIGAGIYNSASKYYLDEHPGGFFRFKWLESGASVVEVLRGPRSGQSLRGRGAGNASRELAIVQAITDTERNRVVLLCVGSGTSSTFGAARYLAENWRQVHRRAKNRDFGLVLSFPGQVADVDDPASVHQPIKVDEQYGVTS